jgi:hypothetical protein
MDPETINKLADEFNRLQELRAAETAGLRNQRESVDNQIHEINEKYEDQINEIESKLGHILYIARYNKSELEIIFRLKDAAENYYRFDQDDHYFNGFYEGMKELASLFLSEERLKEIDQKARNKFPKLLK